MRRKVALTAVHYRDVDVIDVLHRWFTAPENVLWRQKCSREITEEILGREEARIAVLVEWE